MESNDTLADPRYFTHLEETALGIELPTKLNFPFCYEPHQIAIQAAEQLKKYIQQHLANNHAFGSETEAGIGKMFFFTASKNLDFISIQRCYSLIIQSLGKK